MSYVFLSDFSPCVITVKIFTLKWPAELQAGFVAQKLSTSHFYE